MSGTSLDGIDVAIVETGGRRVETIGFGTTAYSPKLRAAILGVDSPRAVSRLNFQLGELYARAVLRTIRRFGPVELIGCHGQTVYHEGGAHSMQIGEAAVLAERTGIPVVSNFRARDIAAGGQGAPLVPYVDYLLFRHAKRTRIAASGKVDARLLQELLGDPYYRRHSPKSAGREQYGAEFVARLKKSGLPMRDLIATATVLTAATIALGVAGRAGPATDLIVSGGGVHNARIMAHLAGFLPGVAISTSTDHGIDADAKEAIAFAVLAHQTWRRKPSNLPSATGARRAVVLGDITP